MNIAMHLQASIIANMTNVRGAIFREEKDVRSFIRKVFPYNCHWVEPARGSTMGMSDCIIAIEGKVLFLELKLGSLSKDILEFKVRSPQRQFARRMVRQNMDVRWLVGVKGTRKAFLLDTHSDVLQGKVDISD